MKAVIIDRETLSERRMDEVHEAWGCVLKKLEDFYGKEDADRWAVTANPQLGGLSPEEAWKTPAGRARVCELVNEIGDGLFI